MKTKLDKLALAGGTPVLREPLPPYQSLGEKELNAVSQVIKSGCLSGFYGSWGDEFLGGPMVRDFEQAWSERFDVRYSVSFNSATSGLVAAMGAIGIKPGDEVIVPPFTMTSSPGLIPINTGIPP